MALSGFSPKPGKPFPETLTRLCCAAGRGWRSGKEVRAHPGFPGSSRWLLGPSGILVYVSRQQLSLAMFVWFGFFKEKKEKVTINIKMRMIS